MPREKDFERPEKSLQLLGGVGTEVLSSAMALGRGNLDAGIRAAANSTRAVLDWQREITDFGALRLDRNVEHCRSLLAAGGFTEVLQLQAGYMRTLLDDYVQGAQKLLERSQDMMQQGLVPLRERAEEAAKEIGQRGGQITRKAEAAAS